MLESMKSFTLWFLNRLPAFLMSEPIVYFVALIILCWILKIIFNITTYHFSSN